MKTIKSLFPYLICLFLVFFGCTKSGEINEQKTDFNNDWKFQLGDVSDAQQPDFNDSGWRKLNLPHDWSIEGKFSKQWASATAYLPTGIGWYRKTFKLEKDANPTNHYIYFDGVMMNSEVWINGKYLGKRPSGFVPFYYEITNFIIPGESNVIAVKVDHTTFADSRWYVGSGINRNVYLIKKDPLHIDVWGVKFNAELSPDNKSAEAEINVDIINDRSSQEEITVSAILVDAKGNNVSETKKNISIAKGEKTRNKLSFQIKNPSLWSVDNPNMYKLKVQLLKDNLEIDNQVIPVGIRSIQFDADQGFFLNGINMKMKGVCIHDDGGSVFGTAVPKEVWARRLKILKEGGANAIRMSHNPHADYLYDLCDELGLMVMDEAYDEWEYGKKKWIKGRNVGAPGFDGPNQFFKEWAERDTKTFVARNQNHPSIILWSIGNEIDYPNDPYTHPILDREVGPQSSPERGYKADRPNISETERISANLVKWIKEVDQTRPTTAALAGLNMSNFTTYPDNIDVVGYNYYERLYEEDHKKYPSRIIYGSENGKGLSTWEAVENNDYISGIYLWTGVDYLGETGEWPSNHSSSGLLDLTGDPKSDYYFQKSLWVTEPMVYMGTSKVVTRNTVDSNDPYKRFRRARVEPNYDYNEGDTVKVSCYTNCEEAELFLNGKSLDRKKLSEAEDRIISWDFPYEEGIIVVKGFNKGVEVGRYQLQTVGEPVGFSANFDKETLKKEGDLAHLKIEIVDKDGNVVTNANNVITVDIKGVGELLGVESGKLDGEVDIKSHSRDAFNGKLLAFIKPLQKKGNIVINISSPGLESKTVTIAAK
jgi:beta-galactosidase/beta-glucuronidase